MKKTAVFTALLGLMALGLRESGSVGESVQEGLNLCAARVIPALFPFLVVSTMLLHLGFGPWAGRRWGRSMALFGLPGAAASAVVLGAVGGYPVGVRTTAELYREGCLSREEAQHLLTFCDLAGPAYFLSVLGEGVFGSIRAGAALWSIHLTSAALTGLLFRRKGARRSRPIQEEAMSFPTALVRAVGESGGAMVSICAFVCCFTVLSRPLRALGGAVGAALTGGLELFSMTPLLCPDGAGFVAASACASWGGVSVLCQGAAALSGSGLSARWCLVGKAVRGLLAGLLAAAVWQWM